MLSHGWELEDDENRVHYLAVGDFSFDWLAEKKTKDEIIKMVNKKQRNREIIGLNFYFSEERQGVTMLLFPDFEISFNLSVNRKKIENLSTEVIDVNWYLKRLIPCFGTDDLLIERLQFLQER